MSSMGVKVSARRPCDAAANHIERSREKKLSA
jgi:hypothetical protein